MFYPEVSSKLKRTNLTDTASNEAVKRIASINEAPSDHAEDKCNAHNALDMKGSWISSTLLVW